MPDIVGESSAHDFVESSHTDMHSSLLELALRTAADAHRSQTRKASDVPYITHPCAVAMILQRAGYHDDELLAAAILHDVVEDTDVTLDDLQSIFPRRVCALVADMSEQKLDAQGQKRPWQVRKQDHLEHLRHAPSDAVALALADKVHNLSTIVFDLQNSPQVWERFSASPDELLRYNEAVANLADREDLVDERVHQLADEVRKLIAEIASQR